MGPSFFWLPSKPAWPRVIARGGGGGSAISMDAIKADFVQAAQLLCKGAGFDCIELHCGHGYLLSQFLTPLINRRADAYGGSTANRARFPIEVARAIRSALGPGVPIVVKVSGYCTVGQFDQVDPNGERPLLRHQGERASAQGEGINMHRAQAGGTPQRWPHTALALARTATSQLRAAHLHALCKCQCASGASSCKSASCFACARHRAPAALLLQHSLFSAARHGTRNQPFPAGVEPSCN